MAQTPSNTAVATREEAPVDVALPIVKELDRINRGDIQMVPVKIRIPANHQYRIKAGREQNAQGEWVDKYRVGVTADGYDTINRVVGAQFLVPEYIHDEEGKQVRNPIHRTDYIYERMVAIWYNDLGQMQAYSEDLEVDYKVLYQQSRLNASWKVPKVDADGKPVMKRGRNGEYQETVTEFAKDHTVIKRNEDGTAILNDDGFPSFDLVLPDHVEAACLQRLYDLRVTGMRYAQTVLKNRLMKVVTGIRMLPIDTMRPAVTEVMAFRDNLTPDQRIKKAEEQQSEVFGRPLRPGATLSDEEISRMELDMDPTDSVTVDPDAAPTAAKPVGPALEDDDDQPDNPD